MQSSVDTNVRTPRIALALGGGGTRGLAHIGVLRVLQREGIPIDAIAGTSMGAIVGGLFCAGVSVDEIEKTILDKQMLHAYLTVPIPLRVAAIPIFLLPHAFGYHPYDGLYRGKKFRNYVNNQVSSCARNIEDLTPRFCAVAANLRDGKPYAIKQGNLGKAIQASSAIPFLRRPVPIDDKLFVDGGIEANLPVLQARDMGADFVIAVDVDETFDNIPQQEFHHMLSVPQYVVSMLLTRIDEDLVSKADVVIHPNVNGIHLLSERKPDAFRAIEAGEQAAEAALPAIRARLAKAALATHEEKSAD